MSQGTCQLVFFINGIAQLGITRRFVIKGISKKSRFTFPFLLTEEVEF